MYAPETVHMLGAHVRPLAVCWGLIGILEIHINRKTSLRSSLPSSRIGDACKNCGIPA